MKLRVDLVWNGGLLADGEPDTHPEPEYELFDSDAGKALADAPFRSYRALEAHIAAHYPGAERWVPPPAPSEEAAKLERLFGLLELPDAEKMLDPRVVRNMLVGHLYQYGYPPETVARIRARLQGIQA